MAKKTDVKDDEPDIENMNIGIKTGLFRIVGTTSLIMHRQSSKAQHELLYPSGPKNKAERSSTLKHNPPEEYRSSMYRNRNENTPTLVHMPNDCFKKAIAQAAIDLPGASKAQLGRHMSIVNETVFIYGQPQLYTTMVRTAGMNKTPDVRTRACFPNWCCELHIQYSTLINPRVIEKMLIAAGVFVGIGDWRPEKGGDHGKWRVIENEGDEEYNRIVENEGRACQLAAYETPIYYDDDSAELIEWWLAEHKRRTTERGHDEPMPKVAKRTNGKGALVGDVATQ